MAAFAKSWRWACSTCTPPARLRCAFTAGPYGFQRTAPAEEMPNRTSKRGPPPAGNQRCRQGQRNASRRTAARLGAKGRSSINRSGAPCA